MPARIQPRYSSAGFSLVSTQRYLSLGRNHFQAGPAALVPSDASLTAPAHRLSDTVPANIPAPDAPARPSLLLPRLAPVHDVVAPAEPVPTRELLLALL